MAVDQNAELVHAKALAQKHLQEANQLHDELKTLREWKESAREELEQLRAWKATAEKQIGENPPFEKYQAADKSPGVIVMRDVAEQLIRQGAQTVEVSPQGIRVQMHPSAFHYKEESRC